MGFKAVDVLEEASQDTKELIFPFDLRTWGKLALIAVLAGGTGGMNFPGLPSGGSDYPADPGSDTGTSGFQDMDTQEFSNMATGAFSSASASMAAAGLAVTILSIILFFMYISSVFKFIYYRSLLDNEVEIISNFQNNMENGFRLFGFRLAWALLTVLTFGGALFALIVHPLTFVLLLFLLLPLMILNTVINGFVNVFVVLQMLETDQGFIRSAKSVYRNVRREWKEFIVFLLMNVVIGLGIGILVGIGALTALVALALPLGLVGAVLYLIAPILTVPVAVIGILAFVAIVLIGLIAPTTTFLYYYYVEFYHSLTS